VNIPSSSLTRGAGVAAAIAGSVYVAVQIKHPPLEVASVEQTQWLVRSVAKAAMAALALVGITGIYLHQRARVGALGLVGYAVFAVGYLTMFSVEVVAAVVLPTAAEAQPGWVDDVLVSAAGGTPQGDIGGMATLLSLSGAGYILGGLLFGIALLRAGVLARWAAALLAGGAVGTAALAALPESFNRPMAVPVGVALIGLGLSLWRNGGDAAAVTVNTGPVRDHAIR
jgi:hypothetical protein